jgi:hypothetical protein
VADLHRPQIYVTRSPSSSKTTISSRCSSPYFQAASSWSWHSAHRAKRMGRGDDIGNAATAMAERMQFGVPQANGSVEVEPTIDPQQVARAVVYMASLPLDANVLFLTVMATRMPFVGRG